MGAARARSAPMPGCARLVSVWISLLLARAHSQQYIIRSGGTVSSLEPTAEAIREAEEYCKRAYAILNEDPTAMSASHKASAYVQFDKALALDPYNVNALVQLARLDLERLAKKPQLEDVAFDRLHRAFHPTARPNPVPFRSLQGQHFAALAGRRAIERSDFKTALALIEPLAELEAKDETPRDCARMQLATLIKPYTESVEAARQMLDRSARETAALLAKPHIRVQPYRVAEETVINEEYNECMLNSFYHSFYYEEDMRARLGNFIRLAQKAWPELRFTAKHLEQIEPGPAPPPPPPVSSRGGSIQLTAAPPPPSAAPAVQQRRNFGGRRLRVGVASAFFNPTSSVLTDFGGVVARLSREHFELTLIHVDEKNNPEPPFLQLAKAQKNPVATMVLRKERFWLQKARARISQLNLDLLLFLDLTMSSMLTRIGMSRLAHVQATTHGHPITSGIDASVMHYYISWGAAELPTAHEHYTERLVLLPGNQPHQYWSHRSKVEVDAQIISDRSIEDDSSWRRLTRADFAEYAPAEKHWYVCMQKPFKLHPAFDSMLARIQSRDPNAWLLLHEVERAEGRAIVFSRYERAGIDLARVAWLPVQPRAQLLALYRLSEVVLDSYYASGCTTTREALEVGAVVVTLPAKYLGSRWTLAFYRLIGVSEMIATDADHYVQLAVEMGTQPEARQRVRDLILANVDSMFKYSGAVFNWMHLLTQLAKQPVPPKASIRGALNISLQPYEWSENDVDASSAPLICGRDKCFTGREGLDDASAPSEWGESLPEGDSSPLNDEDDLEDVWPDDD